MPPINSSAANTDQTLAVMNRAIQACRDDPFRCGYVIELPAYGEILATGDLHGNVGNLRRIMELAALKRNPNRHLILQELVHEVDSPDDICRSYRLVETAAQLKSSFPDQVHILLGNHEFSEVLRLEIGKGGRELNAAFGEGVRAAYAPREEEVMNAYREFWRNSPLAVRTANGIFVSHSTPRLDRMDNLSLDYLRAATAEEIFRRNSPAFAMLWDRDYREEAAENFARRMNAEVLIVGHTPCVEGVRIPNSRHIILDCKDLQGRYALLPLDRELTQRQALTFVHKLFP